MKIESGSLALLSLCTDSALMFIDDTFNKSQPNTCSLKFFMGMQALKNTK